MSNFKASSQTRNARKTHQCDSCCEQIFAGETYCVDSGVYDGSFYSNKLCGICNILDVHYNQDTHGDEYFWPLEHWNEDPNEDLLERAIDEAGVIGSRPFWTAKLAEACA